jgi:hypothetical protein
MKLIFLFLSLCIGVAEAQTEFTLLWTAPVAPPAGPQPYIYFVTWNTNKINCGTNCLMGISALVTGTNTFTVQTFDPNTQQFSAPSSPLTTNNPATP